MMTAKRSADNEQELLPAKRTKVVDGQHMSTEASSETNSGVRSSLVTRSSNSHNAVINYSSAAASSVMTCSYKTPHAIDLMPNIKPSTTSSAGKYLLKTITPDQQVVEEKFVDKEELPLKGKNFVILIID